jgi:hypothetical protein
MLLGWQVDFEVPPAVYGTSCNSDFNGGRGSFTGSFRAKHLEILAPSSGIGTLPAASGSFC